MSAEHIMRLIREELRDYDPEDRGTRSVGLGTPLSKTWHRRTLQDFRAALIEPVETDVNFSGGITQACWSVTRSNGDYRVIFIPSADCFSLAVETIFGPVDIGVHGDAVGCFGSV